MSNLTAIFSHPRAQILINYGSLVSFSVVFQFSVSSQLGDFTSYMEKEMERKTMQIFGITSHEHTNGLLAFHIIAKKFNYVSLKTNNVTNVKKTFFFDGPGLLSERKMLKSKTIKSTSFQCILAVHYVYGGNIDNFEMQQNTFDMFLYNRNYQQIRIYNRSEAQPKKTKLSFACKTEEWFCVKQAVFKSPRNSSVNVSMSSFEYNGSESLDCIFGGVEFWDFKENKEVERTMTKCPTRPRDWQNLPDIHSDSNALLFVGYSHKGYGSLRVTVDATYTHCVTIKINICAFSFWVQNNWSQLEFLERFGPILSFQNSVASDIKIPRLLLNMDNATCTSLQLYKGPFGITKPKNPSLICNTLLRIQKNQGNTLHKYVLKGYIPNDIPLDDKTFKDPPRVLFVGEDYIQNKSTDIFVDTGGKKTTANTLENTLTSSMVPLSDPLYITKHGQVRYFFIGMSAMIRKERRGCFFADIMTRFVFYTFSPTNNKSLAFEFNMFSHQEWAEIYFGEDPSRTINEYERTNWFSEKETMSSTELISATSSVKDYIMMISFLQNTSLTISAETEVSFVVIEKENPKPQGNFVSIPNILFFRHVGTLLVKDSSRPSKSQRVLN